MSVDRPADLGALRLLAVMRVMWCYNWLSLASYDWHVRHVTVELDILPPTAWHPASIARWFDVPPSVGYAHVLTALAIGSTLLLLVGVWTRGMSVVCFVTNTVLMCVAMSWGKIGHNTQVMMLLLFVMTFSDWGHCWSIDSVISRLRGRTARGHVTAHPAWPVWMCTFVLALLYVNSGLHKFVRGMFLDGGFEQYLRWRLVHWEQVRGEVPPWVIDVVTAVLEHPTIVTAFAVGALLFETGFFVALLSTRLRLFMLFGVFVFHGLIGVFAGMFFVSPMVAASVIIVPTALLVLREHVPAVGRLLPVRGDPVPRPSAAVWVRVTVGMVFGTLALLSAAQWVPADYETAWPTALTETLVGSAPFLFVEHRQFVVIVLMMLVPCVFVGGWILFDVLRALVGSRAAPGERVLLYDGDCGFCRDWCDWVRARGAEPAIRFEACQAATALRKRAGISEAQCAESAFLVETRGDEIVRTRRAAGAINGVLAALPGWRNAPLRALSLLYGLEGFRQIEDAGYRLVARWRASLGGACRVGQGKS